MIKKILAVCIALLYSIAYVVVGPMIKTQNIVFNSSVVFPLFLNFVLCSLFLFVIFSIIPERRFDIGRKWLSKYIDKLGDKKLLLMIWGFIFLSWIPAFLILFPGVLSYDSLTQVGNALGEITSNHHPILHTWLIRIFMKLGDSLFSCYEYGIGLMSLVQMAILSYALARLVIVLKKKNVPIIFVALTTLLSALWYTNACLSVTMVKDTLHAAFLILFVCHFVEIVLNPAEYVGKKTNLIIFPSIVFLMCAFRNNGLHIYLFCLGGLMLLRIKQVKKVKSYIVLIVSMLLPVLAFKIYTGPVFSALGIQQGEVREALCIPIQQMQRVAVNRANELTEEQNFLMDYYITDLSWREWDPGRKYDPFMADPAKSCFISSHYDEDPIAFWKFYLKTGEQFSKEYVVAFLSNTLGFWYPGYYEYTFVMYDDYPLELFQEVSKVSLERKKLVSIPVLENIYKSLCSSEVWRETPILRIFFVPGFLPWILVCSLVMSWRKRGYFTRVLPLFLPLIAQYGIMLLSPMSSFRYAWPLWLMLPLVFIGFYSDKDSFLSEGHNA